MENDQDQTKKIGVETPERIADDLYRITIKGRRIQVQQAANGSWFKPGKPQFPLNARPINGGYALSDDPDYETVTEYQSEIIDVINEDKARRTKGLQGNPDDANSPT